MFARLLQLKVDVDHAWMLRKFYESVVVPELEKFAGCMYAGLIQNIGQGDEFVSLTFWDSREHADAYGKSEVHTNLHKRSEPFLAETTEWKLRLSDNLELEYVPTTEEPVLQSFAVIAQLDAKATVFPQASKRYVRFVSARIQDGKLEEFRGLYESEILPVLQTTEGCRYAFLMESDQKRNEILSVTVWDDRVYADRYEESGRFAELTRKVKHVFPRFFRWKLALERRPGQTVKTSEDLTVNRYNVIIGKIFG